MTRPLISTALPLLCILLALAATLSSCASVRQGTQIALGGLRAAYALSTPEKAAQQIASYLEADPEAIAALMVDGGPLEGALWVSSTLERYENAAIRDLLPTDADSLATFKASLLVGRAIVQDYSRRSGKPIPESLVLLWRRADQAMSWLDQAIAEPGDDTDVQPLVEAISPWEELARELNL